MTEKALEHEHKAEEHKHAEHVEHKEHESKKEIKINLTNLGKNNKEVLENISFIIIVISSIMFVIGISLGSFIQGIIFLSVIGSFFVMVGIIFYIISQFIEVKNG